MKMRFNMNIEQMTEEQINENLLALYETREMLQWRLNETVQSLNLLRIEKAKRQQQKEETKKEGGQNGMV